MVFHEFKHEIGGWHFRLLTHNVHVLNLWMFQIAVVLSCIALCSANMLILNQETMRGLGSSFVVDMFLRAAAKLPQVWSIFWSSIWKFFSPSAQIAFYASLPVYNAVSQFMHILHPLQGPVGRINVSSSLGNILLSDMEAQKVRRSTYAVPG